MAGELLAAAKRKLNITWDDFDTDARIEDIIADLQPSFLRALGVPTDFDLDTPSEERGLFINAVFYEWNHSISDFWKNYSAEILRVRIKHEAVDTEGIV